MKHKLSKGYIKHRFIRALPELVWLVIVLFTVGVVIILNITAQDVKTTEATYKGYMAYSANNMRPIVEIDGVEYTSNHKQPVRDSSYIGKPVTIRYTQGNIESFTIQW